MNDEEVKTRVRSKEKNKVPRVVSNKEKIKKNKETLFLSKIYASENVRSMIQESH